MAQLTLRDDIAAFAHAVREHLSDLPNEEVDDLTDGLEADLLEQAEENSGEFTATDPEQYAKELRVAAWLPEPSLPHHSRSFSERYRESLSHVRTGLSQFARSTRFGSGITDLLISLRPVWWLLRGWAIATLCTGFMFGTLLLPTALSGKSNQLIGWLVLLACIIVSVQWGRGRLLPYRWLAVIRTLASIVAIILAPVFIAVNLANISSPNNDDAQSAPPPSGLTQDGESVTNIFAYDSDGKPLQQVQLFDQNGQPLVTVGREDTNEPFDSNSGNSSVTVPFAAGRENVWNVFPLRTAPLDSDGNPETSRAAEPLPPFALATPLSLDASTSDTKNTTASPTPSPSPTTP